MATGDVFLCDCTGGFAAFYARYPQLCAGAATTVTGVSADVMAGTLSGRGGGDEELVTPSDNALLGHVNDQVMTSICTTTAQ